MRRLLHRFLLLLAALALTAGPGAAQTSHGLPFEVELVERTFPAMPGLHSFAWAEHDGKWLIVTGRVDGLHPIITAIEPDVFPAEQANHDVWVVDVATEQVWSRPLSELSDAVADPLRVTNAQYHQEGETLYVVGGYGVDSVTGEHVTFPTLTALDVPGVIEAVTTGGALAPHVRQTTDERFAVTGGELRKWLDEFLLIGGHRFDGLYTFDGSGFTQTYTERALPFGIDDDSGDLSVDEANYMFEDPAVLHRRDMTVAPSYLRVGTMDGGSEITEALTLYAGVFQPTVDLPHRTQVHFVHTDVPELVESAYEQQFAHYTAPALPMWDDDAETMHTTFFGGMAEFVYNEDSLRVERDPLVPFTDDVVTLTNDLDADDPATFETVMTDPMPGLLGTNAVLIPAPDVPRTELGVVQLRDVQGRTLAGWIVGGIESETPNPGWMGRAGDDTFASNRIFEVYLKPLFDTPTEPGASPLAVALEAPYPNPFRAEATVAFVLDRDAHVAVEVFDALGRRVAVLHEGPLAGDRRHTFAFRPAGLPAGVYYARVHGDGIDETRPLVRIR
jgi:hypothetical protein